MAAFPEPVPCSFNTSTRLPPLRTALNLPPCSTSATVQVKRTTRTPGRQSYLRREHIGHEHAAQFHRPARPPSQRQLPIPNALQHGTANDLGVFHEPF